MATTVNQAFKDFMSNLEITDLQATTVSNRQNNVRAIIKEELTLVDDFLTGSYRRNTMIRPLIDADVDIFVVLHSDYFNSGNPRGILDKVKKVLVDYYGQGIDISRNGQAVTISYTDFRVDVVPAFHRSGGGYLIPNSSNQSWIETNPKSHVEIWSQMNSDKGGSFVPVVKALKRWKNIKCDTISSFHLETMALSIFQGNDMKTWNGTLAHFFNQARTVVLQSIPDPAPGFYGFIDSYLTYSQKLDCVSPIQTAYDRVQRASDFENAGKHYESIEQWRLIFGNNYFPAYG